MIIILIYCIYYTVLVMNVTYTNYVQEYYLNYAVINILNIEWFGLNSFSLLGIDELDIKFIRWHCVNLG